MDISQHIPDADVLLAMPVAELAGVIVSAMVQDRGTHAWHPGNFSRANDLRGYPPGRVDQCALALTEAWCFLVNQGLLVPKPGDNNNWHVLSRAGQRITEPASFKALLDATLFPKATLHPTLVAGVYPIFLTGDYETCIFKAFKAVEVAVRTAGGAVLEGQFGVPLMQQAFNPKSGVLTDPREPEAEKIALMNLFAGAIGRFKNPASHRHVPITNPLETIEALQFASHLLRLVDDRKKSI